MPKPKTTPDKDLATAPATEPQASAKPRKAAAKPKAATTAPHKHTRKSGKPAEVEIVMDAPVEQAAISHEDIARLAYSYWVARGYQGGSPHEDWVRAEQELLILAKNR